MLEDYYCQKSGGSSSNAVLDKRRLDSYNAPSVANFVRYYYYFFCSFLMVLIITLCLCSQFSDRFLGGRKSRSLPQKESRSLVDYPGGEARPCSASSPRRANATTRFSIRAENTPVALCANGVGRKLEEAKTMHGQPFRLFVR